MTRVARVVNASRGLVLADRAELADSLWLRFVGLMGRRTLPASGGLILRPGGPIHMFFMRMPLDVLHLDAEGCVTHVLRGIRPWRMGPFFVGGAATVELPDGTAGVTQPGDRITIQPASPPTR